MAPSANTDRWKPPSQTKLLAFEVLRFFAEKLPWATLILLIAITLRAAFILLPSRPTLTNDEIARLKALAAQPSGNPPAGTPATAQPPDQLSSDEVRSLKSLVGQSKSLDNMANASKESLATTKANAEEAEKIKEDVKGFLEWVIAIAGIFTIAQTIAAGFTAQSFTRQAERDIQELDKFKSDYGVIAVAGQAQKQAFDTLKELFKDGKWPDWRTKLYSTLDVVKRQSVLSADRYLGFDLLLLQGSAAALGKDAGEQQRATLRGLANFYASKFEFESQLKSAQWQDLERAHHLLQSWLNSHAGDPAIHNDLGLVLCNCANHCRDIKDLKQALEFRIQARAEFDASARLLPRQQRAYYNLAIIAADLHKPADWPNTPATAEFKEGLRQAVELCRQALNEKLWEATPNRSMETEIRYNLACFLALELYCNVPPQTTPMPPVIASSAAEPVFAELAIVSQPERGTILKRYVEADFKPEGDLGLLNRHLNSADQARLQAMKTGLSANAPSE